MRRATSTVSPRRLAVALSAAAFATVVLGLFATAGTGSPGSRGAATAAAPAQPRPRPPLPVSSDAPRGTPSARASSSPAVGPRPAPSPVAPVGEDADGGDGGSSAAPLSDDELAEARQAATDFAVELATYRWDDAPDATIARVRPYVTDGLAADLARASGARDARAELEAREEVATATVLTVQTETLDVGFVRLVVAVRQVVTSTEGEEVRFPSYLVRVEPTDDGWRVAAVEQ